MYKHNNNNDNTMALFKAYKEGLASGGDMGLFYELLKDDDFDPNAIDKEDGQSLMHKAALAGDLTVCKILKEKGGDVNIKEQRNQVTPLHWAAREGKLNVLEFLLENGADINFQDKDGYSALHYAALNGHTDVVRHLVKEGANVNAVDNQLRTPLHRACEKNRFDCVKILVVDGKADVNKQNRHGWTALHYASYANYSNICVYLLNRGASQELKDSEGRKPLFWGYGYFDQFEESEAEKQGH